MNLNDLRKIPFFASYNMNNLMLPPEDQPLAYESVTELCGVNAKGQRMGIVSSWNTKQAVLLNPVVK